MPVRRVGGAEQAPTLTRMMQIPGCRPRQKAEPVPQVGRPVPPVSCGIRRGDQQQNRPTPCIWLHAQARRRRSFVPSTSVASQTHQKTSNLPIPAFLIAAPGIWTLRTHCSSRDHAVVELRISVVAEREGRCCRVPCRPTPCIWLHAQARRRRSFVPSTSVASQTHQKTSNLPIPAFLIAAPGIWTLRTHCSSRDHAVVELRISVVAEREGRCCRVPC